jgi:hypothetical protein
MIGVLTGDIIDSRKLRNPDLWMEPLKDLFNEIGSRPRVWDIYRGDAFQLVVSEPQEALVTALKIKALLNSKAGVGARLAIGIGDKNFDSPRITESNGQAFVLSGTKYEMLKKEKVSLAIDTPWPEINRQLNVIFQLGLIAIDSWSRVSAEYVYLRLAKPHLTQVQLAKEIGISQPSISTRHKRSWYDEIMLMEQYYRELISQKPKV